MSEWLTKALSDALASGSWLLYALIFFCGVFASFTPCTYPVLPLTVGYVGGMAGGRKRQGFLLSCSLVFGMAITYALVGTIFAALGAQFGSLWGNGWVVFAIALFFLLMSLFLLDVFQFPSFGFLGGLQAKAATGRRGMLGAFLVGAVSGLIVGPCTGPILAVVIGVVTVSLDESSGIHFLFQALNGGIKFFLFGLGQGFLVLLCGTFAGLLSALPRSGAWLVTIKKAFALMVMLGASLLLVYVGQSTNFPDLITMLASIESNPTSTPLPEETEPAAMIVSASQEVATPAVDTASPELDDVEKAFQEMEAQRESGKDPSPKHKVAPDFTLKTVQGEDFTLSKVKGKNPILLVFFATWCPYCMAEVPRIIEFSQKHKEILVYGVDYKQEERMVTKFIEEDKVTYGILMDKEGEVAHKFGVVGIPQLVGIDLSGNIQFEESSLPEDVTPMIKLLTNPSP